jgi:hypothetical protein
MVPDYLLGDTRVVKVVGRLAGIGWLHRGERVGVVIEDCPVDQRIFANSLVPALRSNGLVLAGTAAPECFQGISDLGTISGQMANAVVQFRSNNVAVVMFVSQGEEGTMAYEFMLAAGNQQWYPAYALSSASDATILQQQGGVPQREFANARGLGWIPPVDSADLAQLTTNAASRSCVARVRSQGLQPKTETDDYIVGLGCDTFGLYDALLRSTGGRTAPSSLYAAEQQLGSRFQSALTVEGATGVWDHGRLTPVDGRFFQYVPRQGGFVYTSAVFAL